MGLLDSLFGKKVTLEIPDQHGNVVKKRISRKMFDEMVARGHIKPAGTVKAHILDPIRGYYSTDWVVGEDISEKSVANFGTSTSEIYVIVAYKGGKPNMVIAKKEIWDKQRVILDMINRGEDYQEALDAHLTDLKNQIKNQGDETI